MILPNPPTTSLLATEALAPIAFVSSFAALTLHPPLASLTKLRRHAPRLSFFNPFPTLTALSYSTPRRKILESPMQTP